MAAAIRVAVDVLFALPLLWLPFTWELAPAVAIVLAWAELLPAFWLA